MIDHIYRTKLRHWDPTIRTLASKALSGLAKMDFEYVRQSVIPYLLENSLDPRNVQLRHGATIGLAEIIVTVGDLSTNRMPLDDLLPKATLLAIAELVPTIEKNRLYRGKGGEQMRAAVCRLIECISTAALPLTVPQQVKYLCKTCVGLLGWPSILTRALFFSRYDFLTLSMLAYHTLPKRSKNKLVGRFIA